MYTALWPSGDMTSGMPDFAMPQKPGFHIRTYIYLCICVWVGVRGCAWSLYTYVHVPRRLTHLLHFSKFLSCLLISPQPTKKVGWSHLSSMRAKDTRGKINTPSCGHDGMRMIQIYLHTRSHRGNARQHSLRMYVQHVQPPLTSGCLRLMKRIGAESMLSLSI